MPEIAFRCVATYVCATCGYTITIRPCPACCAMGILPPDNSIDRPIVTRRDRHRPHRVYLAALVRAAGPGRSRR